MANLKRGLFRLWIVVSALWLLAGGSFTFITWKEVSSIKVQTEMNNASREKRVAELKAMPPNERERIGETLYEVTLENSDKSTHTVVLSAKMLRETQELENSLNGSKQRLKETLLLTVVPPLALLGLGASLLWAFSGFKSRS